MVSKTIDSTSLDVFAGLDQMLNYSTLAAGTYYWCVTATVLEEGGGCNGGIGTVWYYPATVKITVKAVSTSSLRDAIVAKAMSYEGKNASQLGLSGAWCASFVSKCAKEVGVPASVIRHNATYATAVDLIGPGDAKVKEGDPDPVADRWHLASTGYIPRPGDLVIYDWDGYWWKYPTSNYGDHVGIVRYVKDGKLYTIEGNYKNNDGVYRVTARSIDLKHLTIKGYASPAY